MKHEGNEILMSLRKIEERGLRISTKGENIGRNVAYMIDVLSDKRNYGGVYRTSDMPFWRATALFNERAAKANRRSAYKFAFSAALKAHAAGQELEQVMQKSGLGREARMVVNDYSVFNGLAAVSFQAVYWGRQDSDVKAWRKNFEAHADQGWGPAFQIVAGRPYAEEEITAFADAHVKRDLDNDIIMAQRPRKLRDRKLHPNLKGGDGQWLVLDFVVLKGLELLWRS